MIFLGYGLSFGSSGSSIPTILLSGSLAFGDVVNGSEDTATLTIENTGNATLTVSGITLPDGFTADWTSGEIAAGASQEVEITFAPDDYDEFGGIITVSSDATSGTNTIECSGTGAYDANAQTYITAIETALGSSLSSTQKSAINTLILDLKSSSIWTSLIALYPFIGGTAATHAINAKTPGTYNITWNGTLTHSSNGVQGDGSTGYGNTGINVSSLGLSVYNLSASLYSRTNSPAAETIEFGAYNGESAAGPQLAIKRLNTSGGYFVCANDNRKALYNSPMSTGLFTGSIVSQTDTRFFQNGTQVAINTESNTGSSVNGFLAIHAINDITKGNVRYHSARQLSFGCFGLGLSDSEVSILASAVQTLQAALNRDVEL